MGVQKCLFVKKLGKQYIDLCDNNPENFKTALHWAVLGNSIDSVRVLLCAGASLIIRDADRRIPLSYAKEKNNEEIIWLLENNIKGNIVAMGLWDPGISLIVHAASGEHLSLLMERLIANKNAQALDIKLDMTRSFEVLPATYKEQYFYNHFFLTDLKEGIIPRDWKAFRLSFKDWTLASIKHCFFFPSLNIQTGIVIAGCTEKGDLFPISQNEISIPAEYYMSRGLAINMPTTNFHRKIVDALHSTSRHSQQFTIERVTHSFSRLQTNSATLIRNASINRGQSSRASWSSIIPPNNAFARSATVMMGSGYRPNHGNQITPQSGQSNPLEERKPENRFTSFGSK